MRHVVGKLFHHRENRIQGDLPEAANRRLFERVAHDMNGYADTQHRRPVTLQRSEVGESASLDIVNDGDVTVCYTSHVTSHIVRHTSHVVRHTSYVTRHTSHVVCHTSYVTRHMSHVTGHTSQVTGHTSHVQGDRTRTDFKCGRSDKFGAFVTVSW